MFLASAIFQICVVVGAVAWSYNKVVTGLVLACGALTIGLVVLWGRYRALAYRDRWVRHTVVQSLGLGGATVGLDVLVNIIGTEDVRAAQQEADLRMEELLYERYRNGEASDH